MARPIAIVACLALSGLPSTRCLPQLPKMTGLPLSVGLTGQSSSPNLVRIVRCAPNLLIEAESNFDTFYKRWWVNPNYVLPGIIRATLGNVLHGVISSEIPIVGPPIADLLLEASDNAPPKRRPLLDLVPNAKHIPQEVKALVDIVIKSTSDILESPCILGTEHPLRPEQTRADLERLRDKYVELAKVFVQGANFTLQSPSKVAKILLPHLPSIA